MQTARNVTNDIHILPSYVTLPGFGVLPVNAFVLRGSQPLLVDTGLAADRDDFLRQLESVIDPRELRWLYMTHNDADHMGSFRSLMAEYPQIRLITTYIGFGAISLTEQIPLDRIYLLNPGESLDLGDRQITVYKPPTYDNAVTTGFYDSKTRALISADCFGSILQSPAEVADDIAPEELRAGQALWTSIDSPWLHKVDRSMFASELNTIRAMEPSYVLSAHLPPARTLLDSFVETLNSVPDGQPFVGPNQPALEAMLAQMTGPVGASV